MRRWLLILSLFVTLIQASAWHPLLVASTPASELQAPLLKWENKGCYSSWCETGWYSSPAVADLDGDGVQEIISAAYSIVVLDGPSGALEWRIYSGHDRSYLGSTSVGRTWPGVVVADLDANGDLEFVTAHGAGYLSVYNHQGYFEPGWPKNPTTSELRGLSAADLDANGDLELVVTAAIGSRTSTWVYEHTGVLRPGWPQLNNDSGYAYGVFNANAAVGDMDRDGLGEVVVPSDVHYINAYKPNGVQIPANPIYGSKGWGLVGVWESLAIELSGWGTCDPADERAERYRANFAHGPAIIADLDGNGSREVAVVGNVYDCIDGYPSRYNGLFIFNPDRSRFKAGNFDWESIPLDTGAPLSEDYNEIENNQPNSVAADLDGDGQREILVASYDGRMHAFWLDKNEHGSWPYAVTVPAEGFIRFASEPVVADLDDDGYAEVLFSSWVEKSTTQNGRLHILDYLGNPLHVVDLPPAFGNPGWNGGLAAPTLANIDADADLEVLINTAHSGVVAYDLPGTSAARILWGTGRGSYLRNGTLTRSIDTLARLYLPWVAKGP